MEQNQNKQQSVPWQGDTPPADIPLTLGRTPFPTGKKELLFGAGILVTGLILSNFILWGGLNLGFAVAVTLMIAVTAGYLLLSGCKPTPYAMTLLGLSIVIAGGFGRSGDFLVKFMMLCFLFVSVLLGLCLLAGQNYWPAARVHSLLDAPRTLFRLGFGKIPEAFQGIGTAFHRSGKAGKAGGAVLLGMAIAIPILAVMVPLLISADAAFDGLVQLLPKPDIKAAIITLLFGAPLGCLLYVLGTALRHSQKEQKQKSASEKGLNTVTVNTVLGAVCFIYGVYLMSQLAYFAGGFAGILPEGYTVAAYARRGFFEMACLSGINLGLIALFLGVGRKKQPKPLSTRILCLFVGIVTLFLAATASGKMFLYIGTYGLTRLRVLTQVIMLFVALTTALVCLWLFVPKLPYMKAVTVLALVIGAVVIWADVDTQVARYNVDAYLSGKTQTVDVVYLQGLSEGAVPYLAKLAEQAPDAQVANQAKQALARCIGWQSADFRGWNYARAQAIPYLPEENVIVLGE